MVQYGTKPNRNRLIFFESITKWTICISFILQKTKNRRHPKQLLSRYNQPVLPILGQDENYEIFRNGNTYYFLAEKGEDLKSPEFRLTRNPQIFA